MRRVLSVAAVTVALCAGYAAASVAPWSSAEAAPVVAAQPTTRILPACSGNDPDTAGDDLCGAAANSCATGETLMTVWSRTADAAWSAQDTLCVGATS